MPDSNKTLRGRSIFSRDDAPQELEDERNVEEGVRSTRRRERSLYGQLGI